MTRISQQQARDRLPAIGANVHDTVGCPACGGTSSRSSSRAHALGSQMPATGSQALARLLAELRASYGLSQRRLAKRSGVARSTITRIEAGTIRVRPATLSWIAHALNPDRRSEVLELLAAAAGDALAADTPGWTNYRLRAQQRLLENGQGALSAEVLYRARLGAASEAMFGLALRLGDELERLTEVPGAAAAGRFWALSDLSDLLHAESERLAAEAGIGVYRSAAPRRWRGDPVDANPQPPDTTSPHVLGQWVRDWQVRQGRPEPRTVRERAIAATGTTERASVAAATQSRTVQAESLSIAEDESRSARKLRAGGARAC